MIQAKIIADSIDPRGNRLTTFVVTFPRIILAEFNTHRMFSRNSASSRAIPFEKMVKSVQENPFIPIAWQKDHKGMQGIEYFSDKENINFNREKWLVARNVAIDQAVALSNNKVTKQLCNRLLEPFMWHTVIVTSGEEGLENFFELRCPKYHYGFQFYRSKKDVIKFSKDGLYNDGRKLSEFTNIDWLKINVGQSEIHMMQLSEIMYDLYNESIPKELKENQWHIPFIDSLQEYNQGYGYTLEHLIKIAVARCARVSYTVVGEEGKEHNYENDIKLYDRLLESKHLSPFEHCARVMNDDEYSSRSYIGHNGHRGWCKNFRGFIQQRHFIDHA